MFFKIYHGGIYLWRVSLARWWAKFISNLLFESPHLQHKIKIFWSLTVPTSRCSLFERAPQPALQPVWSPTTCVTARSWQTGVAVGRLSLLQFHRNLPNFHRKMPVDGDIFSILSINQQILKFRNLPFFSFFFQNTTSSIFCLPVSFSQSLIRKILMKFHWNYPNSQYTTCPLIKFHIIIKLPYYHFKLLFFQIYQL